MDGANQYDGPMKGIEDKYTEIEMESDETPTTDQHIRDTIVPEIDQQPIKSYRDMVVNNGFEKLNPDEIVELVAEDYVAESDPMDMNMEIQTPFNPKPNIEVSLEEYEEWCRPWKFSLIIKPLGKLVNLQAIDRWVQRRWAKKGSIRVMDLVGNFFLVSFGSQEDYGHALFEGPWMIADHYLLVQRWRPLFMPMETQVQKIAVWVRIPNLPAELYNKYFLWKFGKSLGTMLKVDELTSIHSRGKFARNSPTVAAAAVSGDGGLAANAEKEKEQNQETINGKNQQNRKEQLVTPNQNPDIEIPKNISKKGEESALNNETVAAGEENQAENLFGPWMLVKRNQRRNKPKMGDNPKEKKEGGSASRFQILAEEYQGREGQQAHNGGKTSQPNMEKERNYMQVHIKQNNQPNNARSAQKHKQAITIIKEKGADISKKIQNKPNQNHQTKEKQKAEPGLKPNKLESQNEHKNLSKEKEVKHQDYWRQFSKLSKEIAKSKQESHLNITDLSDPHTTALISKFMGGGAYGQQSAGELQEPPDSGELNLDESMMEVQSQEGVASTLERKKELVSPDHRPMEA
ncbi:uncharacterized protein LOC130962820 [Arachis stenosperma]|uniref:uncharacterized protein LOC130962820 n=1 Tax=Arachis stenosperma TaxID=217475 RepID=UPI0025AC95F0|nr:uncharacterized protein LOC130962820 [Arachis stenosperma]